jgi:hypothetical protein
MPRRYEAPGRDHKGYELDESDVPTLWAEVVRGHESELLFDVLLRATARIVS